MIYIINKSLNENYEIHLFSIQNNPHCQKLKNGSNREKSIPHISEVIDIIYYIYHCTKTLLVVNSHI